MQELELRRLKGVLARQHLVDDFDPNNPEYYYRNGLNNNDPIHEYLGPDCLRFVYARLQGMTYPISINKRSPLDFISQFMTLYQSLPNSISSILELLRTFDITFHNMWQYLRPSICIIIKDVIIRYANKQEMLDLLHLRFKRKRPIQTGSKPIDKLFPPTFQDTFYNLDHFNWDTIALKLNEADANLCLSHKDNPSIVLPFLYAYYTKCYGKSLANINAHHPRSQLLSVAPSSFILKQIQNMDEHVSESTVILQIPDNLSPYKFFWITWHYNMGICISNKIKDLPILLSNLVQNDLNVLYTQNKVKFSADQLAMYCARIYSTLLTHPMIDGDMGRIHEYLTNGHDLLKSFVIIGMAAHSKISSKSENNKSWASTHLIRYLTKSTNSPFLLNSTIIAKGLLYMNNKKHVPLSKSISKSNNLDYLQECCQILCTNKIDFHVRDLQDVDFACNNGLANENDMVVVSSGVGFGLAIMGSSENKRIKYLINKLIHGINKTPCEDVNEELPFSNITGMYMALILHYLQSNKVPDLILNVFQQIDTPDAFLHYKVKYSIEESLYRALLISLSNYLDFESCLRLCLFPFFQNLFISYNLGNTDLQSHYYAIMTGVYLGKCILKIGTQDKSLLNHFQQISKCFKTGPIIQNSQVHFYSNVCIMGLCCVYSGSCSESIGGFIKQRISSSKEYLHHAMLQQSLGLLFLGNGTCTIRNSLVGQAFTLLLVFPSHPMEIEDHSLIFPALRYLWIHAIDDRQYETRNLLNDTKVEILSEIKTSFTENKELQITPLLVQNALGSQNITIKDDNYEPIKVELYMNEYCGIKTDDALVNKGVIHVMPKEVYPLHLVLIN